VLSPTRVGIEDALSQVFPSGKQIDVLTFFFAGHATIIQGSLYLCPRDTQPDRVSLTAFPILSLFSVVNEFQPRQLNIIIDACQAGGSALDASQLLKPEVVGHSKSSSVTFLGACCSDEVARETPDGGVLTRQLMKCLTGEMQIQTKSPALDLIEISAEVSQEVHRNHPTQKPLAWALSLFGNGFFARNPHFASSAAPHFPVTAVLPQSEVGEQIRLNSSAIWDEYRSIKDDPNSRRLLDLLALIFRGLANDLSAKIICVRGLARTLAARARESSELLAPSQCLAACAVHFLPEISSDEVKSYATDSLREIIALDTPIWSELLVSLKKEPPPLLSEIGVLADLYYLPLRITKILGWLGLSILTQDLLPGLGDGNDSLRFSLASALVDRFCDSIVVVSDEQASSLYVFLKACVLRNQTELAKRILTLYFASFAAKKGNVTRVGIDGNQALRYLQSIGPEQYRPVDWRPANPSLLLPVMLLLGEKLDMGCAWDLRALDRQYCGFFIPQNYGDFGNKVIEHGDNYTYQIGFGVWKLADFVNEFDRATAGCFVADTRNFSKEGVALCTAASLLFPDRMPFLLECMLPA
jgi:hypothetical protein